MQSVADSLPDTLAQKGQECHSDRTRGVETIFGSIELKRDYLYSPKDTQGSCPLDQALGQKQGGLPSRSGPG